MALSFCGGEFLTHPFRTPRITSRFPSAAADIATTDVLRSGVPFYAEGIDEDYLILRCRQEVDGNDQVRTVEDVLEYRWRLDPPNPQLGQLEGAPSVGSGVENLWSSAVVFRINPDATPGSYSVDVVCEYVDQGIPTRHADVVTEPWPSIRWNLQYVVHPDCTATLTGMTAPQTGGGTSAGYSNHNGPCCGVAHQFHRGPTLQLRHARIEDVVTTGRYTVLDVRYEDPDYLVVFCEDLSSVLPCEDSQASGSFGPFLAGDVIRYAWTMLDPAGQPGGLVVPGAMEHAVPILTTVDGDHQVCVTITDGGQGPDDPERLIQTVTSNGQPLVIVGSGPMTAGNPVDLSSCETIRLYVNDDDDGRKAPGSGGIPRVVPRDCDHELVIAAENDMYSVLVLPTFPLGAGQSLEVRFRVLGEPTLKVYRDATHSLTWASLASSIDNQWAPLPAAGINVWLEGLRANTSVNGTKLAIDTRRSTVGQQAANVSTRIVEATCFAVTDVSWSTGADPVIGHATAWQQVPREEAPDNLAGRADAFFIEPDPRLHTDARATPDWSDSRRNEVLVTATIQPPVADIPLWARCVDVDDNTLERASNDYVDDAPRVALSEVDNHATLRLDPPASGGLGVTTRHGFLREAAGSPKRARLDLTTAGGAVAGQVTFLFGSTYGLGDNFRVVVSLAEADADGPDGATGTNVMAPGPSAAVGQPDYTTSPLAYRRPLAAGAGYLAIPDQGVPSRARTTPCLTVRRVCYVEDEHVAGAPHAVEPEEFGLAMRRVVNRVTPHAGAPGAGTYIAWGTTTPLKQRYWLPGQPADQSTNWNSWGLPNGVPPPEVPLVSGAVPMPMPVQPRFLGPLAAGRIRVGAVEYPIHSNGSMDALVETTLGVPNPPPNNGAVPFELIAPGGAILHAGTFASMQQVAGGTQVVPTAPIPPGIPLDATTRFRVSASETPLEANPAMSPTLLFLPAGWGFEALFFGDDERWLAGPPPSPLDLTGNVGGAYNLINHYLRNLPMRMEKLPMPFSMVWPFGPSFGAHSPPSPDVVAFVTATQSFNLNYMWGILGHRNCERSWFLTRWSVNESLANESGDTSNPGIPLLETPQGATPPLWSAGLAAEINPAWAYDVDMGPGAAFFLIQSASESERELYDTYYNGVNPVYAPRGAPRRDVFRARIFAHEFLHSLMTPYQSVYPVRGDDYPRQRSITSLTAGRDYLPVEQLASDMHRLPGITSPPRRASFDPISGKMMDSASQFTDPLGNDQAESDVCSYAIYYSRRLTKFPWTRR